MKKFFLCEWRTSSEWRIWRATKVKADSTCIACHHSVTFSLLQMSKLSIIQFTHLFTLLHWSSVNCICISMFIFCADGMYHFNRFRMIICSQCSMSFVLIICLFFLFHVHKRCIQAINVCVLKEERKKWMRQLQMNIANTVSVWLV